MFVLCFQIIGKFDKELTKSIQDDYKDNAGSWDSVQKEVSCFLGPLESCVPVPLIVSVRLAGEHRGTEVKEYHGALAIAVKYKVDTTVFHLFLVPFLRN